MKGISLNKSQVGYRYIPKVACTSIKEKLYEVEYGRKFKREEVGKHIHQYMNHEHLESIDECDFRFIVVRDPVKRFLSAFSNRVSFYKELSKEYIQKNCPDLLGEIFVFNPDIKKFIKDFHKYIKVPTIYHHFGPISNFLDYNDLSYFTKVYGMEGLNELERDLSDFYGKEIQFEKTQTGGSKSKVDIGDLSRDELEFIIDFYKDDYVLLNEMYPVSKIIKEWEVKNNCEVERPFIIWTLRRCGGTNLGEALFKASKYNAIQHEPFNGDRLYGEVTKAWIEHKDLDKLYKSIECILEERPLIKHCFEIIPDEINQALLELSCKFGYKHIFLYREYPTDRLLSLNYAQVTGVWGKEQKSQKNIDSLMFGSPVDVSRLIKHEHDSRRKMKLVYNSMIGKGIEPLSVTFESLYSCTYEYSRNLVLSLFGCLAMGENKPDDKHLKRMLRGGAQGTKNDYLVFPKADQLIEEAKKIERLTLNTPPDCKFQITDYAKELDVFELWKLASDVRIDYVYIEGVIFDKNFIDYKIFMDCDDGERVEIETGLDSPRVAAFFNQESDARFSRFLSVPFKAKSGVVYLEIDGALKKLSSLCFSSNYSK